MMRNYLFKVGTYGRGLEHAQQRYREIEKFLQVRIPMSVDDYRLVARLNVVQILKGLQVEIQEQWDLHPEDREK